VSKGGCHAVNAGNARHGRTATGIGAAAYGALGVKIGFPCPCGWLVMLTSLIAVAGNSVISHLIFLLINWDLFYYWCTGGNSY